MALILLLLLALALALSLSGCTADQADSEAWQRAHLQAITFGTSDSLTRTAQGTLSLEGGGGGESLHDVGFGVFACHTGLHPYVSSDVTQNFMCNQQVSWDATNQVFDYSPVVYWPAPVEGLLPYVSFFAYAPYAAQPGTGSTPADRCIVDMTLPVETGDPWLVYQLGGTEDDWQSHQVDLVYDFRRDQQQDVASGRVNFQFRHALACAGDQLTVTCGTAMQQSLRSAYSGESVTLTLTRLQVTYTLLRKGILRLNGTTGPNWQAVASEDPTVRRRLTFTPNQVLATATSASDCTLTDFSVSDQGIFYIPLTVPGNPQRIDITVDYVTSLGTTGTRSTTADLTSAAQASQNRNLRIVL